MVAIRCLIQICCFLATVSSSSAQSPIGEIAGKVENAFQSVENAGTDLLKKVQRSLSVTPEGAPKSVDEKNSAAQTRTQDLSAADPWVVQHPDEERAYEHEMGHPPLQERYKQQQPDSEMEDMIDRSAKPTKVAKTSTSKEKKPIRKDDSQSSRASTKGASQEKSTPAAKETSSDKKTAPAKEASSTNGKETPKESTKDKSSASKDKSSATKDKETPKANTKDKSSTKDKASPSKEKSSSSEDTETSKASTGDKPSSTNDKETPKSGTKDKSSSTKDNSTSSKGKSSSTKEKETPKENTNDKSSSTKVSSSSSKGKSSSTKDKETPKENTKDKSASTKEEKTPKPSTKDESSSTEDRSSSPSSTRTKDKKIASSASKAHESSTTAGKNHPGAGMATESSEAVRRAREAAQERETMEEAEAKALRRQMQQAHESAIHAMEAARKKEAAAVQDHTAAAEVSKLRMQKEKEHELAIQKAEEEAEAAVQQEVGAAVKERIQRIRDASSTYERNREAQAARHRADMIEHAQKMKINSMRREIMKNLNSDLQASKEQEDKISMDRQTASEHAKTCTLCHRVNPSKTCFVGPCPASNNLLCWEFEHTDGFTKCYAAQGSPESPPTTRPKK